MTEFVSNQSHTSRWIQGLFCEVWMKDIETASLYKQKLLDIMDYF